MHSWPRLGLARACRGQGRGGADSARGRIVLGDRDALPNSDCAAAARQAGENLPEGKAGRNPQRLPPPPPGKVGGGASTTLRYAKARGVPSLRHCVQANPGWGLGTRPPNGLHGNKMPPGPGEAHAAPFGLVRPGSLGPIRDFSLTPGTAELIPCPQREKRKSTRV